ncbi:MAG: toxin-antitoxin system YwqK family antitoxin [Fibrobacteres bacterium]|nr:toxin-antitoxin system YwqK family antitoxin [Fibrobacterota bacterium]
MGASISPVRPGDSVPVPRPSAVLLLLALAIGIGPASALPVIVKKEIQYPDGKLKESFDYFIDGQQREVRDGLDEEFYPNGGKKGEIPWRNGKEDGLVVYYYQDGRKSYEANYKEGKKNGFATVWYPNGQKQWQTVFRAGLTHGVWREWYADGKKKFEANYSDGKLDGLATWWYDNGHIWQERSFQDGALTKGSVREWDRAGRQTFPPPADSSGDPGAEPSASPPEPVARDTSATGDSRVGK